MINHADVYRHLDKGFEWLLHYSFCIWVAASMDGKDPKSIAMQVAASLAQRCVILDQSIPYTYICSKPRVLTINTNHLSGNILHRHKNTKFDVVGEQSAIKYIYLSLTDLKVKKIAWPQNKAINIIYLTEVPLMEWCEAFDFPTRISVFHLGCVFTSLMRNILF